MAQIDPATDALVGEWLSLPQVAEQLGIPSGRVKQLLRDRKLLAVKRPDGTQAVPAAFLEGNQVLKGLCGTFTLLFDCGFDEPEVLRWLFTADDSLPGHADRRDRQEPADRSQPACTGPCVLAAPRRLASGYA